MASDSREPKLTNILLTIALGVLSWIAYTTQQTSVSVAVMAERGAAQDRRLNELGERQQSLAGRVQGLEVTVANIKR